MSWLAHALGHNVGGNSTTQKVAIHRGHETGHETLPSLTYSSSISVQSRKFTWSYRGRNYQWKVEVPTQVLSHDQQIYNDVARYYSEQTGNGQQAILSSLPKSVDNLITSISSHSPYGDYIEWVHETNAQYIGYVAKRLSNQAASDGYDYFHTAEFALSFVNGAIPYQITRYPQLPAQTMFCNGDCKDKSILLAVILKDMGYNVSLLAFSPPSGMSTGHVAVGIAFTNKQIYNEHLSYPARYFPDPNNGTHYYFAETTAPGWLIGQRSDLTSHGQIQEQIGHLYPVQ